MKAFVNRSCFIYFLLVVTACNNTNFRYRLCESGETELPKEIIGRYQMTIFSQNPIYSGTWTKLKKTEIEIHESDLSYTLGVSSQESVPQQWKNRLASIRYGLETQQVGMWNSGNNSRDHPLNACRIGKKYYVQGQQPNGTYNLTLLEVTSSGFSLQALGFEPDELIRHGFNLFYLPQFDDDNKPKETTILVDNINLNYERRQELMSISHPAPYGQIYNRIMDVPSLRQSKDLSSFTLTIAKK